MEITGVIIPAMAAVIFTVVTIMMFANMGE